MFLVVRYSLEDAVKNLLGVRPDGIVMRVVVAPDEIIHPNRMTGHDPQLVVFKGGIELTPEIGARLHGEIWGSLLARPISGVVEALEHMSQPACLEFTANKLEPGVTFGYAGANELPMVATMAPWAIV
jgi:hypothetical protein